MRFFSRPSCLPQSLAAPEAITKPRGNYSQKRLPLKVKHLPPPPPPPGEVARGLDSCRAVLGSGFLWQTPLDPSTKPLSQLICTQRSPSAFWPLPQISGQT